MRKRIAGETEQPCRYEGTYYYEQDPSQTKFLRPGRTFPPVLIRPLDNKPGEYSIGPGIWVLRYEDSPRKTWRELGHLYLVIFLLGLVILAYGLAVATPLILRTLSNFSLIPH